MQVAKSSFFSMFVTPPLHPDRMAASNLPDNCNLVVSSLMVGGQRPRLMFEKRDMMIGSSATAGASLQMESDNAKFVE
jgi:hypothetical protein